MPSRRAVLASLASAGLVGVAGCGADQAGTPPLYDQFADGADGWPSAAHDPANTRHAPQVELSSPTPTWRVDLPASPLPFPPLVHPDGDVVVADRDAVRVVGTDGSPRWQVDHDPEASLAAPPVLGRRRLAFVDGERLRMVDLSDGEKRWGREVGWTGAAPVLPPRESPRKLLVASRRGRIRAFDRGNGAERWDHDAFGGVEHAPAVGFPSSGREAVLAVATTAGLELLTTAGVGHWRRSLPRRAAGRPVLNRGQVLVPDGGGTVHAFDVATGEKRWETRVVDPVAGQTRFRIAATANSVFVADGRFLHALSPEGNKRWAWGGEDAGANGLAVVGGGAGSTSPEALQAPGTVVVPGRDRLVGVAADGGSRLGPVQWDAVAWTTQTDGRVGQVAVAGDRAYATVARGQGSDQPVAFE